jgi:Leucine-rich repeat (LRR) protein
MRAFRNTTITEIAFIACGISRIEDGTFDGLSSLEVLNLADNSELKSDDVIDALSTSSDVTVKTLILDAVGSNNTLFIAGLHEHPSCRSAWKHLRKLSVRCTNIVALYVRLFENCLTNLEAIAFGFNTVAKCGKSIDQCHTFLFKTTLHLRYIDMAYYMVSDTQGFKTLGGYLKSSNWVKLNEDYFPSYEEYSSDTCNPHTSQSNWTVSLIGSCQYIPFPPCLTYIKADHWFINIFEQLQHRNCLQFANNTLMYVNVSSRFSVTINSLGFNRTIFGFSSLRTIDGSGVGLLFLDFDTFRNFPSLEILNLAGNRLGHKQLSHFPRHDRLQELNMAANAITEFPANMFVHLVALQSLDISKKQLKSVLFELPPHLKFLDLSWNLLTSFDTNTQLMMNALPSLVLHLDHNPFQCDCPETSFIEWFQNTVTNITNRENITCQQGISTYHIITIRTSLLEIKCGLTVNVVVVSSVVVGVVILMATLTVIMYR